MQGIYRITNTVNGKHYIGSSIDIERRLEEHRSYLERGKHYNPHLQRAWLKYGAEAFLFEVLEEVAAEPSALCGGDPGAVFFPENAAGDSPGFPGKSNLLTVEDRYLKSMDRSLAYNIVFESNAVMTGRKHSAETKAKMSDSHKGKVKSAETRARMSAFQLSREREDRPWANINRKGSNTPKRTILVSTGGYVLIFSTQTEAAKFLGVKQCYISQKDKSGGVLKGYYILCGNFPPNLK